jgi:hypothetical protein
MGLPVRFLFRRLFISDDLAQLSRVQNRRLIPDSIHNPERRHAKTLRDPQNLGIFAPDSAVFRWACRI